MQPDNKVASFYLTLPGKRQGDIRTFLSPSDLANLRATCHKERKAQFREEMINLGTLEEVEELSNLYARKVCYRKLLASAFVILGGGLPIGGIVISAMVINPIRLQLDDLYEQWESSIIRNLGAPCSEIIPYHDLLPVARCCPPTGRPSDLPKDIFYRDCAPIYNNALDLICSPQRSGALTGLVLSTVILLFVLIILIRTSFCASFREVKTTVPQPLQATLNRTRIPELKGLSSIRLFETNQYFRSSSVEISVVDDKDKIELNDNYHLLNEMS